jgi:hypothetical protein
MRDGFFLTLFIPLDLALAGFWVAALMSGRTSRFGTRWPADRELNPGRYWLAMVAGEP